MSNGGGGWFVVVVVVSTGVARGWGTVGDGRRDEREDACVVLDVASVPAAPRWTTTLFPPKFNSLNSLQGAAWTASHVMTHKLRIHSQ